MLVRFFIHQINAPGSYWYLSQSFIVEKRHGLCKSYSKVKKKEKKRKEKKEIEKKIGQVSEISKTMGT